MLLLIKQGFIEFFDFNHTSDRSGSASFGYDSRLVGYCLPEKPLASRWGGEDLGRVIGSRLDKLGNWRRDSCRKIMH